MFQDRGSGYWVLGTGITLTPTPSSGTVELWNRGIVELWNCGTVELWNCGIDGCFNESVNALVFRPSF
jgi:hypothetical protein